MNGIRKGLIHLLPKRKHLNNKDTHRVKIKGWKKISQDNKNKNDQEYIKYVSKIKQTNKPEIML